MNYIILNDVNSNTIQGLLIQNLPPITKPKIRTNIEEIDGRDGDIITELGYSAYEKEFDIGLYGNYDVDQVISYFNSEGTVIFSNEDDKFYKYTIIEQIDFERLIRFKTAKVKMHVQPFKYSNTDTDIEIYATETDAEGTNLTINNTENGASFLDMQLKGQTEQTTYTGKNFLKPIGTSSSTSYGITRTTNSDGSVTLSGTASANTYLRISDFLTLESNTAYTTLNQNANLPTGVTIYYNDVGHIGVTYNDTVIAPNARLKAYTTGTVTGTISIAILIQSGTSFTTPVTLYPMLVKGSYTTSTLPSYEPYVGGTASPNPSYPQNVNVVTGNTSVKICNKNLLNISNIETGTKNGVTLSLDEDKIIINGTCTSYTTFNIPCELSGENMYSSTNWNGYAIYGQYKGSGVTSFTSNGVYNGNIDKLVIGIQPNTSFNNQTIQLQVEKNSTATSYVAHQEQNYTINLGNLIYSPKKWQLTSTTSATTIRLFSTPQKKIEAKTYKLITNLDFSVFSYAIEVGTTAYPFSSNLYDSGWKNQSEFTFTSPSGYIGILIKRNDGSIFTINDMNNYTFELRDTSVNDFDIELCQIGQYQDYIHKNNGNWYIHKEIGKVVLNGSETPTINTALTNTTRALYRNILPYNSKAGAGSGICNLLPYYENWVTDVEGFYLDNNTTNLVFRINKSTVGTTITSVNNFLSENNMTLYYILATSTETQITDENLIAQLEGLRGASTYINQTNIITSGDLAPIIYVNVDTIDTNEIEVINSGNIYSKPVVTITGIGTINLYLNDYQVFILELGDTETTITLDVENMEAYNINTGQLMNRQVTGDYNNFIFNSGTNIITWSGTIASVQVVNYSRWI